MMVGLGSDFWGSSIFVLPENVLLLEAEFLETKIKIFPVILSLFGGGFAFLFYNFFFKALVNLKLSFLGKKFYTFFNRKWFFDKIYNEILSQNTLTVAYEHGYQNIDRGVIELIGPNGIWQLFSPISNKLNYAFNFHIDTPKKLRSFFKILFITFLFIYLLIFGAWYLNSYETYIQLYFNGYNSHKKSIDFLEYYPNYFFENNSSIQNSSGFIFNIIDIPYPKELIVGNFGEINKLILEFNIIEGPFDRKMRPVPYLPFDERWIPELKKFLTDAAILEFNFVSEDIKKYFPKEDIKKYFPKKI
jgi:hypothetical protein